MNKVFSILISVLLLSSCAYPKVSHHLIRESAKTVNVSDGVQEYEAILLAQMHIINKGIGDRLYTLKPFKTKKIYYWMNHGKRIDFVTPPANSFDHPVYQDWEIYFRERNGSFFFGHYPVMPLVVVVNALDGSIQKWEIRK